MMRLLPGKYRVLVKESTSYLSAGKNYEKLIQVCNNMDLSLRILTKFYTNTFANGVRFVYSSTYEQTAQICVKPWKMKSIKDKSFFSDGWSKATNEDTFRRTIDSWTFCLTSYGCADTYNLYGLFADVS